MSQIPSPKELERMLAKMSSRQQAKLANVMLQSDKGLAMKKLDYFAIRMLQLIPARHHKFLNEKLEAVERGEIKRLMILMPPGHAKSTYASWLFPAWYLGRNPTHKLISASYKVSFAEYWGKKVRNLFTSQEWPFDVKLADDTQAAGEWATQNGGEYVAAGAGGTISGRRANLVVIDDPFGSKEEADSKTLRDQRWGWYLTDLYARLFEDAAIILINTRWNEDDMSGRILPVDYSGESGEFDGRDGRKWQVISFPALAEQNDILGRSIDEALWPEMFSAEYLLHIKYQDESKWSALYQQRPSPETGEYFRRDWIRWYETPPKIESLRLYGASDYAITLKGGDFTVHGVVGIDVHDDMYVLDWYRGQIDSAMAVNSWAEMAGRWKPVQWGEDKAQIEKTLGPFIEKRQRELRLYCHRQGYPVVNDKVMRAQAIRGRMSQGKVYFPAKAPWVTDLVRELLVFPNGRHDDQVDVLSIFGRMLTTMRPEQQARYKFQVVRGYANRK